ncbi:PREDICTED: cell wall protein AWA1-like isoform X4 [Polistes dominula]|uniref:Cell wall protein AWA1-like isoform X2 n=1 Tax=Polistes dominula TaxID=743375 RepID=A0ABM1IWS3_POLDO|nr:PREDICTED: cell wall protein AWA1-like isoform X2 [Polistes dominula]XP_015184662.1 PREDICTED: cell wall protein AWA1-like isoform X3 [Polistes dominula]XP_015184663.1 PREDICTED: cell wall protein AWA1-like isoform X4 [Polistes dominula]
MDPAIDRMTTRLILLVILSCFTSFSHGFNTKCRTKTSPGREVICYTSKNDVSLIGDSICRCTTLVHLGHDIQNLSITDFLEFSEDLKEVNPPIQFVISINDPAGILKTSGTIRQTTVARLINILNEVDGVELNVTAGSKERLYHFVKGLKDEMVRKSIDKRILMALPTKPEDLAKQFDLKQLSKYVDLFTIATHYLTDDDEVYYTFHPSRMIGLFDMLNTDSLVDLISGLGAPKNKLLISMPASAYKFNLKNETENAPRSNTEDKFPTVIDRKEFCESMDDEEWTIERDEDLTAPYAFKNKTWIAFEDKISARIKGKYVILRGLAGLGIWDIENDLKSDCGEPITHDVYRSFRNLKKRSAHDVFTSLEDDLHQAKITYPNKVKSSLYRVVRVVDTEGHIRAVRENTQTEFPCVRQGFFVHPKSCNRFYRCVKFNQAIENYSVFEFDCPAGLAFDERTEVCVWPGSLSQGSPCPGSSEVAPAPQIRFQCPPKPGYYADPRNCRWFFACMDLGGPEMVAFEFRCPYELVFDQEKLVCEWPWLVPSCSSTGSGYTRSEYDIHASSGSTQGSGRFVTGGIPDGFSGTTGAGYYQTGANAFTGSSDTRFTGSSGTRFTGSSGTRFTGSSGTRFTGSSIGHGIGQSGYSEVTGGFSTGSGTGSTTGYGSITGSHEIGGHYTGSVSDGYKGSTGTGYIGIQTDTDGSRYSGSLGSNSVYRGSTTGIHAGSGYTKTSSDSSSTKTYSQSNGQTSFGSGYSQGTRVPYQGSSNTIQTGGGSAGSINGVYTVSTNGLSGSQYTGGLGNTNEYSESSSPDYIGGDIDSGFGYKGPIGDYTEDYNEQKGSNGYSDSTLYSGVTKGTLTQTGGYTGSSGSSYTDSSNTGYSQRPSISGSSTGIGHAGTIDYAGSTGSGYTGSDLSMKTKYTSSFNAGHFGGSSTAFTGSTSIGSNYPDKSIVGGKVVPGVLQGGSYDTTSTLAQGHTGSSTHYFEKSKDSELPGYTIPVQIIPGESPYYTSGVTGGSSVTDTVSGSYSGGKIGSGSTSSVFTNYQGQTGTYITDHAVSGGPIYSSQSGIKTTYTDGTGATSVFRKDGFNKYDGVSGSNLNITLVLDNTTPIPNKFYQHTGYTNGYNLGQTSTGTIITGNNVEGAIITDDSSSGSVITQGDISGSISTGSAQQGTVITGSSQPGYVKTQTGSPGYVVSDGVKTIYSESSSPGTLLHGSVSSGVSLGGTPTSGVILQGQSSPSIHLTGQTSSGVVVGGNVQEGTTVGGNYYYTGSESSIYSNKGSSNVGQVTPSTTERTSYKINEYHDNGGRGTIKFNNGLVTTKYTESDLKDYRTSIGTLPDNSVPGGRFDGIYSQTGSSGYSSTKSNTFTQDGFTKTGPTRTGYVTATLGGRGSYTTSTGQRPAINYDKIGENAFDGNVAGYTKTSKIHSNVITSTEAPDATHVDTSKITLGPSHSVSNIYDNTGGIKSSTTSEGSYAVTTPSYLDVGIYQTPSTIDSARVTPVSITDDTYNKPSYVTGQIPTGFVKQRQPTPTVSSGLYTTGPIENYRTTVFEAAKIPVSVSMVQPVFDNGYKTIISSTPIPISSSGTTYTYKDNRFNTGSLSTHAQSVYESGGSFQSTGLYNQTGHIPVTTSLPSVSISSGYVSEKSRPSTIFGTYNQPTVTSQPEIQYVPSSTTGSVSNGFNGYTYTKGKIPFGVNVTPSTIIHQQSTESVQSSSTTPSSPIGVIYTKPFSLSSTIYDQSTPKSISVIGDTSSSQDYDTKTKTSFGSSTTFGESPMNLDISLDKVETLVNNYNRGTVKYVPNKYDTYTGIDSTSSTGSTYRGSTSRKQSSYSTSAGQTYVGSTRTESTPIITTYSGGYSKSSSVTPSYEISTQTTAVQSKGKVIVKWSDLHPLLISKLGAECTCKADPFGTLRGPGKNLINSSKGQIDLANYDESDVYVDLENDDSGEYDYVTNYGSSSPRPFKIENKAITASTDKSASPGSTYLPSVSTSVTRSFIPSERSGKKLEQSDSSTNSVGESNNYNFVPKSLEESEEILEGPNDCARPGLFRHPNSCNKFYACHWDEWKKRFTLHVFNCPVFLTFDNNAEACNWPSKGPACQDGNLLV